MGTWYVWVYVGRWSSTMSACLDLLGFLTNGLVVYFLLNLGGVFLSIAMAWHKVSLLLHHLMPKCAL